MVFRDIGGECILVPVSNNTHDLSAIYSLNEVACRVWQLLDGKRRVEDIVNAIVDEFEVDKPTASSDIKELLKILEDCSAIEKS